MLRLGLNRVQEKIIYNLPIKNLPPGLCLTDTKAREGCLHGLKISERVCEGSSSRRRGVPEPDNSLNH